MRQVARTHLVAHGAAGEDATPWLLTFSTTNAISGVDPVLRNLYTVSFPPRLNAGTGASAALCPSRRQLRTPLVAKVKYGFLDNGG
jgi:hypothetical protein